MINTSVVVEDHQVVKLILEFLDSRRLHNTMRSLEKEAGIVNCGFSDDILFLRDLVLDGEWEAILIFAQPFEGIDGFDSKQFRYLVLKQKFMEVLYFKSGFGGGSTSYSIEDLIKCLNQLEEDCPNKTEYSKLCWLLTVPNLPEQPEYRDWSPATARLNCFEQLLDLLKKVIPIEKKGLNGKLPRALTPIKDRLLHLLIKGLCFESCVDYCQLRAINGALSEDFHVCVGNNILRGPSQESSGNFLSWLRNLSQEAFITPFEPVNLEVDLKKVKQSSGVLFHKSPRRDDAEVLSRSLSLSGRPATADIASHLAALETGKNTALILNNRAHSTQPPKGGSHSYSEFHYKGIPEKEPVADGVSNGFTELTANRETGNEEKMSRHTTLSENISQYQDHHSTVTHATEPNRHDKEIHLLKEQQQQNVLKQLEAHENQKRELERQLLELSSKETVCSKPNGEGLDAAGVCDENPTSDESVKNLKNKHFNDDGDFHGTTTQKSERENRVFSVQSHDLEKVNSVQDTPDATCHQKYEQLDSSSFSVNQLITSTPARKAKAKPEDLNLEEAKDDNRTSEVIPATPAEKMFPYTPLTNGPVTVNAGHWVALADGSGVLNTSTPKSTRQGMSSTPAPLASPVPSVDGATPRLLYESDERKVITNYRAPEEKDLPAELKDKENTSSLNQQLPVKKGPKVNGVRRALVPQAGAKQKVATADENRQMRIPTQGVDIDTQTRAGTNGNASSDTSQRHTPIQQLGQVHQGSAQDGIKVNGQPGTTFVVGPNVGIQPPNKAADDKNCPGGIKASHNNVYSDIPKGREQETINMTYRKPSTNTPPNNTTVTVNNGNHVLLLEKHKELQSDTKFYTVATLEDVQAIRAIAFHPSGNLFAIGSNSKALRVCTAEGLNSLQRVERKANYQPPQPTILFKSNRHHRGSIYCVAWSTTGDIIATGSNDKSIKMTRFDAETCSIIWPGLDLAIHGGTVRDLAFVSRASGSPVLVSGGAGDGNIMISDCSTGQTVGQLKGHSGHIMAVYADSDDIIASGSADNTVRLWDLRSQRCIDAIATGDSCVASVCVNTSGNMLASGHEDGSCMIYDITAGRTLQLFTPHTMDCRSVRFSPDNNFLLTGSYDSSIIMMDVRKDLETRIPPYSVVANHRDKVIQCRWHPSLPAFLSSSADKTVSLWAPDY